MTDSLTTSTDASSSHSLRLQSAYANPQRFGKQTFTFGKSDIPVGLVFLILDYLGGEFLKALESETAIEKLKGAPITPDILKDFYRTQGSLLFSLALKTSLVVPEPWLEPTTKITRKFESVKNQIDSLHDPKEEIHQSSFFRSIKRPLLNLFFYFTYVMNKITSESSLDPFEPLGYAIDLLKNLESSLDKLNPLFKEAIKNKALQPPGTQKACGKKQRDFFNHPEFFYFSLFKEICAIETSNPGIWSVLENKIYPSPETLLRCENLLLAAISHNDKEFIEFICKSSFLSRLIRAVGGPTIGDKSKWFCIARHLIEKSYNDTDMLSWFKTNYRDVLLSKSNSGETIAHIAVTNNTVYAFEWVCTSLPSLLSTRDNKGLTVLDIAIEKDHYWHLPFIALHCEKLILQVDSFGYTIAHKVVENAKRPHNTLIFLLNSYRRILGQQDHEGRTIAHIAASSGDVQTLGWIEENCPEVISSMIYSKEGKTIAHLASEMSQTHVLNWIVQNNKALLLMPDERGYTIAHMAASSGDVQTLGWIEENCPEVISSMIYSKEGKTIAHLASEMSQTHVLNWIVQNNKALLLMPDERGYTIAHMAASSGDVQTLGWIEENCPEVISSMIYSKEGKTIAHLASEMNQFHVLNWIVQNNKAPLLMPYMFQPQTSVSAHFPQLLNVNWGSVSPTETLTGTALLPSPNIISSNETSLSRVKRQKLNSQ